MKHILIDNALEAWAMAIKYCNYILDGRLHCSIENNLYHFLHNSVELFIKQLMLDNNDHRVCSVKKGCDAEGHPALDFFYNSHNLNDFF